MNHRAIEEALDANSPRAGFFIKLRGRGVQAQLSLDKSDHLGKAKSSCLAQTRWQVLLQIGWESADPVSLTGAETIRVKASRRKRELKERSDVH